MGAGLIFFEYLFNPKLAEIFDVSVDDLIQVKTKTKKTSSNDKVNEII